MIQYKNSEIGNTTDTFFVINNPIGITGSAINDTMVSLIQCQTDQIYFLSNYQNYLTIGASGVLIFSFLGIIIASLSADRSINYLWERLRTKAHGAYIEISQNILNRINDYHEDCDTLPIKLDGNQCRRSKPLSYRHSLRYFMNFIPFFMIAGGLYCVLILVEFTTILNLLEKAPTLIRSTYEIRFSIPKIYLLTTESTISEKDYSLASLYHGFTPVADLKGTDISLIDYLSLTKKVYQDSNVRSLLSNEDFNSLYQTYSNSTEMGMGILSAIYLYRTESLFIVDTNVPLGSVDSYNYLLFTSNVAQALQTLCLSIYKYSDNYIYGLLTNFLVNVFIFCVGHVISYFSYYAPYLKREEKVLKTIKKLMEYVPSTTINNSKKNRLNIFPEENSLLEE